MSCKVSTKPWLTPPQNRMEGATWLSAKGSANGEAFCLVTRANALVCGTDCQKQCEGVVLSLELKNQMETEVKCTLTTYTVMAKWDCLTALIIAWQHFWKRWDLSFGLNKLHKCKRDENWKDFVYYTFSKYHFSKKLLKSNTAQSWK